MSKISNFFLRCSGVNKKILNEVPATYLSTETTKFKGIGGAIFFTSALAFISASFASSTFVNPIKIGSLAINSVFISMLLGLLWAFMIFNLDRYIVSSMRKTGDPKGEFYHALPRILIAFLFALIISKPLELEIFRHEIEMQKPQSAMRQTFGYQLQIDSIYQINNLLSAENDTLRINPYNAQSVILAQNDFNAALQSVKNLKDSTNQRLNSVDNEIDRLERKRRTASREIRNINKKIKALQEKIDAYTDIAESKAAIKDLKTERWPHISITNSINAELPKLRTERNSLALDINKAEIKRDQKDSILVTNRNNIESQVSLIIKSNLNQINKNEEKIQQLKSDRIKAEKSFNGLLADLQSLNDLKNENGNSAIFWASTLIFLLFVALEMAPVLVKLLGKQTLYDQILNEYEKPLPNKDMIRNKISGFYEIDAMNIVKEKEMLRNFFEERIKIKENIFQKSLAHIKMLEEERFNENKDAYSERLFRNPKNHFSVNSSGATISNSNGNIEWDDEDIFESKPTYSKSIFIAMAAGLLIILGISIYIFIYSSGPKESSTSMEGPTTVPPAKTPYNISPDQFSELIPQEGIVPEQIEELTISADSNALNSTIKTPKSLPLQPPPNNESNKPKSKINTSNPAKPELKPPSPGEIFVPTPAPLTLPKTTKESTPQNNPQSSNRTDIPIIGEDPETTIFEQPKESVLTSEITVLEDKKAETTKTLSKAFPEELKTPEIVPRENTTTIPLPVPPETETIMDNELPAIENVNSRKEKRKLKKEKRLQKKGNKNNHE